MSAVAARMIAKIISDEMPESAWFAPWCLTRFSARSLNFRTADTIFLSIGLAGASHIIANSRAIEGMAILTGIASGGVGFLAHSRSSTIETRETRVSKSARGGACSVGLASLCTLLCRADPHHVIVAGWFDDRGDMPRPCFQGAALFLSPIMPLIDARHAPP